MLQLRDCFLAAAEKNNNIVIYEVFSTKLKFAADCLLKWFNKKFKLNNLEQSNEEKRKYEIKHPIDWMQDRCCLCPFPLEINLTSFDTYENTMSNADFVIFKEYKFLIRVIKNRRTQRFKNIPWKIC